MNASVWFALLVAAFAGQCLAGNVCPATHHAADSIYTLTISGTCIIQSLHIDRNATVILTGTSLTVTCSIYINESAKLVLIPADLMYPMNVTVGGNVILTEGVIEFHHLHLFVSGMVGLYGDSRLIGDGNGWAGGTSTTPAECPKGTPAAAGSDESGGDGGSHATLGGKGTNHDIPVAVTYDGANTTWYELSPGCGGAGAIGDGGRGGGALAVVAQSFFCCDCTVSANGAASAYDTTSSGGGGAGGSIFISALNVSAYSGGTFTANGGTSCGGGYPGGGGSGGVIRFSYGCSFHDVSATFSVTCGSGGGGDSDSGMLGHCDKDNFPLTDVPPSTCPTHNRIITCIEYHNQGFVSGSSSGGDYTSSDSSLNSYQCPAAQSSGTSSESSESSTYSGTTTAATDSTTSSSSSSMSSTTTHTTATATATATQGTNAATGSATATATATATTTATATATATATTTATATQSSTSTTTAASATTPTASTASTASASATAGSAGSGSGSASGSASAGGLSGTTAADALNPSGGASSPPSSGNGLLIPIVAGVAGALVLVCIIGAVVVARRRKNPRRGRRESEFVDAGGAHLDSVNNKRASFYSGSGTLEGKHQESLIDGASAQGSTRTGEARPSSLATMKSTFVSDGVTSDGPTFKNGQPPPQPSSGRSETHSDAPTMKSSLTGGTTDLTRDDPTYRNGQPPPHMTVDAPTMKSSLGSNGTHINDAPTMKSSLGGGSQMGDAPTMKSTLGSASDPPTVRSQLGDAPTMKSSLGGSGFAGGDPPTVRSVLEGDGRR